MTKVVNYHNGDYFDISIMRPSKWGNPFMIGKDGNRKQVIDKYRSWILSHPLLLSDLGELRGRTLGCCCKPKDCHGDVLAELVDMPIESLVRLCLTELIEPSYVDTWMSLPNPKFGDKTPSEIANTEPKLLWEMLHKLQSGEPI